MKLTMLIIMTFFCFSYGCNAQEQKDTLKIENLVVGKQKALEIANEVADKELKEFNKTKESVDLGGPFELKDYKLEIQILNSNGEDYWYVYYWHEVSNLASGKVMFQGHPAFFTIRVNCKTGKYHLIHGE